MIVLDKLFLPFTCLASDVFVGDSGWHMDSLMNFFAETPELVNAHLLSAAAGIKSILLKDL